MSIHGHRFDAYLVQGSGFRVQGAGFRVKVQGAGIRVQGSKRTSCTRWPTPPRSPRTRGSSGTCGSVEGSYLRLIDVRITHLFTLHALHWMGVWAYAASDATDLEVVLRSRLYAPPFRGIAVPACRPPPRHSAAHVFKAHRRLYHSA